MADTPALYLVHFETVNGTKALTSADQKNLIHWFRVYAQALCVSLLDFVVLKNRASVLIHVPLPPENSPSDAWLLEKAGSVRHVSEMDKIKAVLGSRSAKITPDEREAMRHVILRVMWDVGQYARHVKIKFAKAYNRAHQRQGSLWEARCDPIIVEPAPLALGMTGAYLAMAPVRGRLIKRPEEYEMSSYGAACQGDAQAGAELAKMASIAFGKPQTAEAALEWIREPIQDRRISDEGKRVLGSARPRPILSRADFVRHNVRYFEDGAAIGSKEFINALFEEMRSSFGPRRRDGARAVTYLDPAYPLFTFRQLTLDVVTKP